jgi:3-oxoacyl-[acyl-carrier protein] reductase
MTQVDLDWSCLRGVYRDDVKNSPEWRNELSEQRWGVVTGVGRRIGIGAAICRALAADGVSICFTAWSNYDDAIYGGANRPWVERFAEELTALGVDAFGLEVDLSDPVAPAALIDDVTGRVGMVSIVVNNAAYSTNGGIDELTAEQLDAHYAVNVRGMALLTQAFVRQWIGEGGGRIVNMTSGQSQGPMAGELAYAASKGAVEAFTTSVAPAIASRGITINAVNPGPTDTGWMSDELKAELLPKFPMGRIGGPEDAAKLVAFLCSEDAGWITGQVMHSEGGFWRQ